MTKFAYTLAEVAEMTGIPVRALRDRIKKIPHRRISNKVVVMTADDVTAMLELFAVRPSPAMVGDADVVRINAHREKIAKQLASRRRSG